MVKPIISGRDAAVAASIERTDLVAMGARRPLAIDVAGLARHQHRQCSLADLGAGFRGFLPGRAVDRAGLSPRHHHIDRQCRAPGRYHRPPATAAGRMVLFTAASALCGAAHTLWLLVAVRAVQGLGAAVMMALTVAFVGETVPKARTGSAMGLLGTMSAIGTALGPSLCGILIAGLSWRAIFLVNVPLGSLGFASRAWSFACRP